MSFPAFSLSARRPLQGVTNIIRFNWPFYLAALAAVGMGLGLAVALHGPWWVRAGLALGAGGAGFYLVGSLLVSWWVYDVSPLYRWRWLRALVPDEPARIANIHSGFDESSAAVQAIFPAAELTVLDFYDPQVHTEPSVARARRAYPNPPVPAQTARAESLPLPDAGTDLALLILAAHEIRTPTGREQLLRETARILRPGGQAILVEHGRDLANALAFGPGFLHFYSPAEWRRVVHAAGFTLRGETRVTPFVRVFDLSRP